MSPEELSEKYEKTKESLDQLRGMLMPFLKAQYEKNRKSLERREKIKIFLIHLVIIICCFICIYPLLRIFSISLRPGDKLFSTDLSLIPDGATFSAYVSLLKNTNFLRWLWNSLVITIATSFIGVSLASTAAYAFSRFRFPGKKIGMIILCVFITR